MKKRIIRISPWPAAKLMAVLYFIFGLVVAVFMGLGLVFTPASEQADDASRVGWGFILAMPFFYALGALIFVPVACWIFNLATKIVGGFEFTVVDANDT